MSVYEMLDGQLRGLSYEVAKLYGMPHIGAKYTRDDVNATAWTGDYRRCACCGRTDGFHSKHHEPPKGKGSSFLLFTPKGRFVLKPALIDLCGSGTTGCHGDRHNGRLVIRWEWDDPEYERMWWDGTWLSKPFFNPHGEWLFKCGHYVFESRAMTWDYRGRE